MTNERTATRTEDIGKNKNLPCSLYHFGVNLSSLAPTQVWKDGRCAGSADKHSIISSPCMKAEFNLEDHTVWYKCFSTEVDFAA